MSQDSKKTPPKRNALGRGLSALLQDSNTGQDLQSPKPDQVDKASGVTEIPVDKIETNPFQPRLDFDADALKELSDSILAQGLIQPITVRKLGTQYQLIAGERRFQATKMAGLKTIPAYVRTANDEQMLALALIENIQRQDLNPIEVALSYERLSTELNITLEEVGDKVGKNRATVNNYLRLLKLPPKIQAAVRSGKISMGHARAILGLETPEQQLYVFDELISKDLSVRKVEELVRELANKKKGKGGTTPTSTKGGPRKSEFLLSLERSLEGKFGNRVLISQVTGGKGDIRITFDSTEDLNRILEILEI